MLFPHFFHQKCIDDILLNGYMNIVKLEYQIAYPTEDCNYLHSKKSGSGIYMKGHPCGIDSFMNQRGHYVIENICNF